MEPKISSDFINYINKYIQQSKKNHEIKVCS